MFIILLLFPVLIYCQNYNCSIVTENKDLRTSPNTWTLVQYNVEWLFSDPCSSCPGICTWNDTVDQYTHIGTIRKVLEDINPDTVHMCEVQSCTQLDQVRPSLDYKSYMIEGNDSYTGQNVGLITKIDPNINIFRTELRVEYPVVNSSCGYTGNYGTEGVSKHLITKFVIQNISIYLIGAHLLSNPTDPESCAKREAQSQVLQYKIQEFIDSGNEVILMGDLNDFDGIYKDVNNNEPTSSVLKMLKGDSGDSTNYTLYTVSSKINQEQRYTEWYDANENCHVDKIEYSMIDHILVTKNLLTKIEFLQYYHFYREGCGTYQSDHYPIVVRFRF